MSTGFNGVREGEGDDRADGGYGASAVWDRGEVGDGITELTASVWASLVAARDGVEHGSECAGAVWQCSVRVRCVVCVFGPVSGPRLLVCQCSELQYYGVEVGHGGDGGSEGE